MNVLGEDFSEGPLGLLESQEERDGEKNRKQDGFMILYVKMAIISGSFRDPSLYELQ